MCIYQMFFDSAPISCFLTNIRNCFGELMLEVNLVLSLSTRLAHVEFSEGGSLVCVCVRSLYTIGSYLKGQGT